MDEVRTIKTKKVNVNDITLHYVEQGSGDTVVLVHGGLSDYRMWEGQLEAFSDHYRVIAYSRRYAFPGDASDDAEGYSVVPHVKDLAAFIQALGTGPVYLVGHSYGAYISLLTAVEHPDLVRSLVLGEPPAMPILAGTAEGNAHLSAFENNIMIPSSQAFKRGDQLKGVQTFLDGVMEEENFYDKLPSEVKQQIHENIPELEGLMCSDSSFLYSPAMTCEDISQLKAPVLFVAGEKSPKFFDAIINELEKCILHAERVVIAGASHEMELDDPKAFNEAVLTFFKRSP